MNLEHDLTRRGFVGGAVAAASLAAVASRAYAAGGDSLKVGVIGCGGRGSGAAENCLNGSPGMTITAVGDLFADRADGLANKLRNERANQCDLPPERVFTGFDNFERVLASGVDLVILATPPGFRPQHFEAAIAAGKHVFMEKPVAVDGPGIRKVLAAGELATQNKLGVVAGTQRRHDLGYIETIQRLHDGAIGEVTSASVYWNQGGLWSHQPRDGWTDMEWQIRNWLYFTWLSGDHIVEQHVHNLDVANWVIGDHPVKAYGMGGRQVRTDAVFGHIFDHFAIEYEYASGARVMSMCRQIDGTAGRVAEFVRGTKGASGPGGWINGETEWNYRNREKPNPYDKEHTDLVASIRAGEPLNEAYAVATSTLTAIMGRMSAYTGQEVTWDQALNSTEDTFPANPDFGPLPVPPVAVPGQTRLT